VLDHRESTDRQYALADRAVALGWPRDRVTTIDDDLGKSGQSVEGRPGFQRLLAEVALDNVGLILGLEMSRLARSNRDWHQLLELCSRFRVLLADAESVYDPADHNDRLLLGLHGMMSEAELHVLKERMYQGRLNKARRGDLMGFPPLGYVRLTSGEWAIDSDQQVQATVRLIFDVFDRETTLHGLLRYLVRHGVRIPVRSMSAQDRGELQWRQPNRTTLSNLLHHPTYAGAYRFGHRPIDARRKRPGRAATGKRIRRPEECLVLIRDRVPAYISWDRLLANQERLEANRARQDRPGAPRQGASLLGGLPRCGRCGRRMVVEYSGANSRHSYNCKRGDGDYGESLCQSMTGPALDGLIAARVLAAVEPAALEASLAAVAGVERERSDLARHWQLRLERARQETDRAARQYQACEPENRLVGRELERRWEESLRSLRQLEDEYERWRRTAPGRLSPDDERAIRSLAGDLPAVWHAATTTPAERQRVVRLLVERVTVVVDKASERVDVELHWAGGLTESHVLSRPVRRYELRSDYRRLVTSLNAWSSEGLSAAEIAERLNREGFRPPKRSTASTEGWCNGSWAAWGRPIASPRPIAQAWRRTNTARAGWRAGSASGSIRCAGGSVPAG